MSEPLIGMPDWFKNWTSDKGGINAVKHVLLHWTTGFERLEEHPDLTVEQLVVCGEWHDLFDDSDRVMARAKLAGIVKRKSATV